MKKDEPVTLSGTVRKFDPEALQREYGTMDFGNAPLKKIETVLIVGNRQSTKAEQPRAIERQKPSVTEGASQTQQPEAGAPSELPRTASPFPLLGLSGLMFVVLGLGVPLLRRQ